MSLGEIWRYDDVSKWKHSRITGLLCGEFTYHRWIPRTKANDAELWCLLWSMPEPTDEQIMETAVFWDAIALIMTSLSWTCLQKIWTDWYLLYHHIIKILKPVMLNTIETSLCYRFSNEKVDLSKQVCFQTSKYRFETQLHEMPYGWYWMLIIG